MDFDHRVAGTKDFWIGRRAGSVSEARLRAELAKCDVAWSDDCTGPDVVDQSKALRDR